MGSERTGSAHGQARHPQTLGEALLQAAGRHGAASKDATRHGLAIPQTRHRAIGAS